MSCKGQKYGVGQGEAVKVPRVWESRDGVRLEVKVTAALPTHGFLWSRHLRLVVQDTASSESTGHLGNREELRTDGISGLYSEL